MDDKISIDKIQKLVVRLDSVPTIAPIALKIIKASDDEELSSLVRTITKDQSLSAKILKVANSAYYGFSQKVTTIKRATILLGYSEIRNIAVRVITKSHFSDKEKPVPGFDRSIFWEHTLYVGLFTDFLSKQIDLKEKDSAFFAGLFHDIGIVVLDSYFHDDFIAVFDSIQKEEDDIYFTTDACKPLLKAEKEVLGITHARIGELLLRTWNIPNDICCAVRYHHTPMVDKTNRKLSTIVYLANVFCCCYTTVGNAKTDWETFLTSTEASKVEETLGIPMKELSEKLFNYWDKIKDLSLGF